MPVRMLPLGPAPARTMAEIDALVRSGRPMRHSRHIPRPRGDGNHPAYPPPLEQPVLPEPLRTDAREVEIAELAAVRDLDAWIWRSRCQELMRRVLELEAKIDSAAARKERG